MQGHAGQAAYTWWEAQNFRRLGWWCEKFGRGAEVDLGLEAIIEKGHYLLWPFRLGAFPIKVSGQLSLVRLVGKLSCRLTGKSSALCPLTCRCVLHATLPHSRPHRDRPAPQTLPSPASQRAGRAGRSSLPHCERARPAAAEATAWATASTVAKGLPNGAPGYRVVLPRSPLE